MEPLVGTAGLGFAAVIAAKPIKQEKIAANLAARMRCRQIRARVHQTGTLRRGAVFEIAAAAALSLFPSVYI